ACGDGASRTKESTGPNFWAKPVKSSTDAPFASRCAAIVTSALTVTTPVPPTPVISRSYGAASGGRSGAGRSAASAAISTSTAAFLRRTAPSSVTKEGQKPPRQEKSLLQDDWLMRRLLPNSVST